MQCWKKLVKDHPCLYFTCLASRTGAVWANMSHGTNLELKYKRKLDTKPQKGRRHTERNKKYNAM